MDTIMPPQPPKPLKDKLFQRIETEQVAPRSKLFFLGRECAVWLFWMISVVMGALAISVTEFVVSHQQYALYQATHDNFFTFVVDVLPYLWILTFAVMAVVAVYDLRHTKYGYRYPVWVILASSVVMSFAGGSAMQYFGFGYELDEHLGRYLSLYTSQGKLEQQMWQAPAEGRLIGRQVYSTLAPTSTIVFEDVSGQRWRMEIDELDPADIELLDDENPVRLLGTVENGEMGIFHACGALPWQFGPGMTTGKINDENLAFMHRMGAHMVKNNNSKDNSGDDELEETVLANSGHCAEVVKKRGLGALK